VNVTGQAGPSQRISETPGLTSFLNWRKTRWWTEGGTEEESAWDVPLLPNQQTVINFEVLFLATGICNFKDTQWLNVALP